MRGFVCVAMLAAGCGADESDAAPCVYLDLGVTVFVLSQDQQRQASAIGRLDERGCLQESTDVALGSDPVLSDAHGRPFVVLRDEGVARELALDEIRFVRDVHASAFGDDPPNPHDVDVDAHGNAWVTRYDMPSIARVSAADERSTVDLGAYMTETDPDGLPEMEAVRVEGSTVAVTLQLLDRTAQDAIYPPTGPGRIALFAAEPPNEQIGVITLVGRNPFGRFVPIESGELAVATPGEHGVVHQLDGIDAVDLETGEARQLVSETFLGGTVVDMAFGGEGEAYAILEGPSPENATWVVAFDPRTKDEPKVFEKLDSRDSATPSFVHSGLAVTDCCVIVGDRTRQDPAIWFFDRKTGAEVGRLSAQAKEFTYPPVALLAVRR